MSVHGEKRAPDEGRGAKEGSRQEPGPVNAANGSPKDRCHFSTLRRLHPAVPHFRVESEQRRVHRVGAQPKESSGWNNGILRRALGEPHRPTRSGATAGWAPTALIVHFDD